MLVATGVTGTTAIGNQCLDAQTTGDNNTAVGSSALGANTTGLANTAMGHSAADNITTGESNTILGYNSGGAVTTGDANTAVGYQAGHVWASGASNNIAVGVNAITASSNPSLVYSMGVECTAPNQNNTFAFGNDSQGVVYNQFSANASWTRGSDERLKANIKNDSLGLEFINNLRTVTFNWKPNNELPKEFREYAEENVKDTSVVMHGMIAQEVKEALEKSGVDTFGGWSEDDTGKQMISQELIVHPLIKAVQELTAKVEELENKLN